MNNVELITARLGGAIVGAAFRLHELVYSQSHPPGPTVISYSAHNNQYRQYSAPYRASDHETGTWGPTGDGGQPQASQGVAGMIDQMIEALVELYEADDRRLSAWEADFIESIEEKEELSDRQIDKINELYEKYYQ